MCIMCTIYLELYLCYPPPCPEARSGVFIGCLTGPWDGLCGIVLGYPPVSDRLESHRVPLFRCFFRHRLFHLPTPPLGPIFATFSPPRCPKPPKSDPKGYPLEPIFGHFAGIGGKVRTVFSCRRNLRFHGLRGSREPLVQHVLAIETAIVAQIAYPTPKNEENVGPMAPKVAPGSPKGVPGGGPRTPLFVVFSPRLSGEVPWGAQGRQSTPKGTKMTPKSHQNDTEGVDFA